MIRKFLCPNPFKGMPFRVIPVIFLFVMFSQAVTYSQVKIRERVEISPKAKQSLNKDIYDTKCLSDLVETGEVSPGIEFDAWYYMQQYTCLPYDLVCSEDSSDYHIFRPGVGRIHIKVTEGSEFVKFKLSKIPEINFDEDCSWAYVWFSDYPIVLYCPEYYSDPGIDFTFTSYYRLLLFLSGKPTKKEHVRIDMDYQSGASGVFEFDIVPPIYHFKDLPAEMPQINYGGKYEISDVGLNNQCKSGWPNPDAVYNCEIIKGAELGTLHYRQNGQEYSGKVFTGLEGTINFMPLLSFRADGIKPKDNDTVIIKISTNDPSISPIEYRIVVTNIEEVRVTLDPPVLSPGDTALVKIERWNDCDGYESINPWETYEIGVEEGCGTGEFLLPDGTQTNYYLNEPGESEEQLRFVAADSILTDSVIVKFRVGIEEGVASIASPIGVGGEKLSKVSSVGDTSLKQINGINIRKKRRLSSEELIHRKENSKGILAEPALKQNELEAKFRASIVNKLCNDQRYLNLPESIKKRILNRINQSSGLSKDNHIMNISMESPYICAPFLYYFAGAGYLTVKAPKPELIILFPYKGHEEWITCEPKMPNAVCKAQLKNYKGNVKFEWEYWVRYELNRVSYPPTRTLCSRTGGVELIGNSISVNDAVTIWNVPFNKTNCKWAEFKGKHHSQQGGCDAIIDAWYEGEDIFIGGNIWVKVTAKDANGNVIAQKQSDGGVILGSNNNDKNIIFSEANTNEFRAILEWESGRQQFNVKDQNLRYKKFKITLEGWKYNKKGYPIYGPPNGFGIAQIDNALPPTEMDLWNWKSNINTAQERFRDNLETSKKYVQKHTAPDEERYIELLLKCAYQIYNSGSAEKFYIWDKNIKTWVDNPNRKSDYGKNVYPKYLDLIK